MVADFLSPQDGRAHFFSKTARDCRGSKTDSASRECKSMVDWSMVDGRWSVKEKLCGNYALNAVGSLPTFLRFLSSIQHFLLRFRCFSFVSLVSIPSRAPLYVLCTILYVLCIILYVLIVSIDCDY